jgi:hypothetical protein
VPYFVYKIYPNKKLVPVQPCASFREAKDLARSIRASVAPDERFTAKVIFAKSPEEAEKLLVQEREYIPREDD